MSQNILILGATSAIARAMATEFARGGAQLVLAGRDMDELEAIGADLRLRFGTVVHVERFEASEFDAHPAFFQSCLDRVGGALDGVALCHGSLVNHAQAIADFQTSRQLIEANYVSAVSILTPAANYFEQRKSGWICAISSVAGDRGRQSNYVYGSAKAGLTTYLQGLRNRLFPAGVAVITVKPGFVDTAMTWGLPGLFLVASPQKVARDILRAIRSRRSTIYTPWFWRWILLIIKLIPEPIFKRMKM